MLMQKSLKLDNIFYSNYFFKKNLAKTEGSIRNGGKLIANFFLRNKHFLIEIVHLPHQKISDAKRILQNSFFITHKMFSLFFDKCRYLLCSNYSVDTEEIIVIRSFFSENIWKANFTFTSDGSNPAKTMILVGST